MTIRVKCRTNLDEYKRYPWPTKLAGMPAVGDWIYAIDGDETHVLAVVHVAHKAPTELEYMRGGRPWVDLELHRDAQLLTLAQLRGEVPFPKADK